MDINQLKEKIDLHHPYIDKKNPAEVVIQIVSPGIGATPCVGVKHVYAGFDWDHGKLLVVPEHPQRFVARVLLSLAMRGELQPLS